MKILVIGLVFFIASIILDVLIYAGNFENIDFFNYEIIEGIPIMGVLLVGTGIYVVTFTIFLIIVKNDVIAITKNLTYSWPKEKMISLIDHKLFSKKGFGWFFILSTIITGFVFYVIGISTTDVVISIIPATELVPESSVPCKSLTDVLNESSDYNKFLVLLIGPTWAFLLKQVRDYEIRNSIKKHRGIRILIIFFWAVFILFVLDNIFELGCPVDREPGLYTIPPLPISYIVQGLFFALIYGGPVTGFAYFLSVFIFPRFKKSL